MRVLWFCVPTHWHNAFQAILVTDFLRSRGVEVKYIAYEPPSPGSSEDEHNRRVVRRVERAIRSFRPHIFVSMVDWLDGLLAQSDAVRSTRWWVWSMQIDSPQAASIGVLRAVDKVVCITHWEARMIGSVAPRASTLVIPHAVDPLFFEPMPSGRRAEVRLALGIEPSEFVVGYVGKNIAKKCVDRLLEGFARFAELGGEGRLLLRASPESHPNAHGTSVARVLRELPILSGRLLFFNEGRQVETRALRDFYAAIDLHVSTSGSETFGIPVIEAAAMNRRSLLTDAHAFREVGKSVGADFIPVAAQYRFLDMTLHLVDTKALGRKLLELSKQSQRRALRARVRRQFALERVGSLWLKAISGVRQESYHRA